MNSLSFCYFKREEDKKNQNKFMGGIPHLTSRLCRVELAPTNFKDVIKASPSSFSGHSNHALDVHPVA